MNDQGDKRASGDDICIWEDEIKKRRRHDKYADGEPSARNKIPEQTDISMFFGPEAYRQILETVGSFPAESGGILLGSRDDYVVRKFIFDESGSCSPGGYDPDVDFLNPLVKKEWEENGLALVGFVHSHPRGVSRLSGDWGNGIGDMGYLKRIFQYIPALEKFLVPIIYSKADGREFDIFPYIAWRDSVEDYMEGKLEILEDSGIRPAGEKTDENENVEKERIAI